MIFRTKLTWLKLLGCVVVSIAGAVLVIQPPFIFGKNDKLTKYPHNLLGTALALTAALFNGLAKVLLSKSNGYPQPVSLVIGGLWSLILGLLCPLVGAPNRFVNKDQWGQLSLMREFDIKIFVVLVIIAFFSTAALLIALRWSSATLVAVVRGVEIVMALVVDMIMHPNIIKPDVSFICKVFGSLLVFGSVVMMAIADWLEQRKNGDYKLLESTSSEKDFKDFRSER